MQERPNIVLFMTDQQRGDCLSSDGHPVLLTPNMDSIGLRGTRFRHAYATCPVCIPARRSLLSGQFPATHGMVGMRDGVEWNPPATLPGELTKAGYQTVVVGRSMHQAPPRKRYGFEQMAIADHTIPQDDYLTFLKENLRGREAWFENGVMHNDWTTKPWPVEEYLHFSNWTVDMALKFLRTRDPRSPFFLVVSFLAPHPPLQPPAFYFERYLRTGVPAPFIGDWATPPTDEDRVHQDTAAPGKIDLQGEALLSTRAAYYGLINHIDDQMRRLLNGVVGLPAFAGNNNVIAFTSDHGEMLGDHHMWRKSQAYEPATRVPLLIQGPRELGFKAGQVIDEAVCLEDVMPTLLEIAGVPIPPSVEGRSLLPMLRGEHRASTRGQNLPWRECLHLECAPTFHALTDGQMKYIWLARTGAEQLFDLTVDPKELYNLASEPARRDEVQLWRTRLIERLKGRPEGFTDGSKLIPGRPYPATLPHAGVEEQYD